MLSSLSFNVYENDIQYCYEVFITREEIILILSGISRVCDEDIIITTTVYLLFECTVDGGHQRL